MKYEKPNWCDWPDPEYARELGDLNEMGIRCDAWRQFMTSDTLRALKEIDGNFIWFNRYEQYDKLIAYFPCSEERMRETLARLLRPDYREKGFRFRRIDIFDKRAWIYLPVNWFVEALDGVICKPPILQIGIDLPLTVRKAHFTMTHRLKDGGRFAEMRFNHPDLDERFNKRRWVTHQQFPRAATRQEMFDALFKEVKGKCAQYNVSFADPEAEAA